MSSSGETRDVRGSKTSRTGCSRSESSRALSSAASTADLSASASADTVFLPARGFGLVISSISESTRAAFVPGGISFTATRYCPRASFSIVHRARTRTLPRPVS